MFVVVVVVIIIVLINLMINIVSSSNLLSFCLDLAQGPMNGAPSKSRTHSWKFASLAC